MCFWCFVLLLACSILQQQLKCISETGSIPIMNMDGGNIDPQDYDMGNTDGEECGLGK